ncbi:MAG TPA: UDP-glucose/GDP-mannose dehydrogenase family protein [Hyphomicrobiaceae bacterium]|nr:UDP-glucose/GDP-mannose dehydrogenase family protein [Hyphomicrobiaceae bacterium]
MKLAIVGTGYVGLVTGACLADFGHDVTCVDVSSAKIDALNRGEVPFYEPGLGEMISNNVRAERLQFTTDLPTAIDQARVIMIAVGTPARQHDRHADLSQVYAAAREIAGNLKSHAVVVTKSTIPIGTGDEIERIFAERLSPDLYSIAANPEFLREGAAIRDFKFPDRIIIGTEDPAARETLRELYRPLFVNQAPVQFTSRRTAETIKYAANAFLATKITFINEMADLCEAVGADVQDVARGIGADNRIGSKFLHAGPGFGGSCFPKDTLALATTARDHNAPQRIVETVISVNESRKRAMARRIVDACGGDVRGKSIAVFGLTFKPNTDDIRDTPAISIVSALIDHGAIIRAHDPQGMKNFAALFPDLVYAANPYECCAGADAVAIVTEWESFRALDLARIRSAMRTPLIVDLRNIYRETEVRAAGLRYVGIGKPKSTI